MICFPVSPPAMACYPAYSHCFQMILGGGCDPETRIWAIKEIVKGETSPSPHGMAQDYILGYVKTWGQSEDSCKAIMGVLGDRLSQPWPCNYKALDVCRMMPGAALIGVMDKLKALTEKTGDEGRYLRSIAEGLLKEAKKAKDKKDEEEAKKREAAVAAAWGGLINPAAIHIACPPTLNIGLVPGGVNYYPHYLRPNLNAHVCPVLRCTPSWQPVCVNAPPFNPAFSQTMNTAAWDVMCEHTPRLRVTYNPPIIPLP